MKQQESRAVIACRGAASAGLVSSADRAYMKALILRPTFLLVEKGHKICPNKGRKNFLQLQI